MKLLSAAVAGAALLVLTACSSAASSSSAALPASSAPAATAAAQPSAAGCTAPTFDYIVRTVQPGTQTSAQEIGNCDLASGQDALSDFQQTAGQSSGECTTIAKAFDNPGYNVNAVPAPPLNDVLESAGPGC